MWRYSAVFVVLLFVTFVNCQQQCFQMTTASCDQHNSFHIPAGPKGDRGDDYDPSFKEEMRRDINLIKSTLEEIQSRVSSLEKRTRMLLRRTPRKGNLDEAARMCNEMGGQLLQRGLFKDVHGHNYRSEIYNFVRSEEHWIGATDREVEGSWRFLNGDYFPTTTSDLIANWRAGEPDNWRGGEDCSQIFIDSGVMVINDLPCHSQRYGICEL